MSLAMSVANHPVAAVAALFVLAGATVTSAQFRAVQRSIDNYVAATGNGTIDCPSIKFTATGKKIGEIDEAIRPIVIRGLKNGDCFATLPAVTPPK